MTQKQYEALLKIAGLRAARTAIDRELAQAMRDAGTEAQVTTSPDLLAPGEEAIPTFEHGPPGESRKRAAWTPEKRMEQSLKVRERMRQIKEEKEKRAGVEGAEGGVETPSNPLGKPPRP